MALVNQPGPEGMGSKLRTAYCDIMLDSLFKLLNGFWIEVSLNLRIASGWQPPVSWSTQSYWQPARSAQSLA